jgi:hypothetical protein
MTEADFEIDTYTIPDGVDPQIADQRNQLIESWQEGEVEAEVALAGVARLYWQNQDRLSDETRFWLTDTRIHFAVAAGLDSKEASTIWHQGEEE